MAVAFSAMAVGQVNSFAPDYGKARHAAARVFHVFDSQPKLDPTCNEGRTMVSRIVHAWETPSFYPLYLNSYIVNACLILSLNVHVRVGGHTMVRAYVSKRACQCRGMM